MDNLVKPTFDGLGHIIGFRKKWMGKKIVVRRKAADSKITELVAKKVNSGTDREYLSLELEMI